LYDYNRETLTCPPIIQLGELRNKLQENGKTSGHLPFMLLTLMQLLVGEIIEPLLRRYRRLSKFLCNLAVVYGPGPSLQAFYN
jgi:hypothetical protein